MSRLGSYSENTIVVGDCREVMRELPAESIPLVFTSPPYGDMYFGLDIDGCRRLIRDSIAEIERILVPGGKFVINVNNYVTSRRKGWDQRQIIPMTKWVQEACNLTYQDEIFWYKKLAQGGKSKPLFGSYPYPPNFLMSQRVEYLLVYGKAGRREVSSDIKELSRVAVGEWREWTQNLWELFDDNYCDWHDAPFPESLAERVVKLYSFVGDVVLDPFMGTGTTAVVADRLGRTWLGCDINPNYVERALKRIADDRLLRSQLRLFELPAENGRNELIDEREQVEQRASQLRVGLA